VLGVCDGMGGAAAGEVASQLAVDIIYQKLSEGDPLRDHNDLARRLVRAVEEAGVRIFNEARADRTRRGMGTTATISALVDSRLFVAQVGDSRAYIVRQGKLTQVSRDQSLVNQLIEAGQLTEEEAETFEHNNIILQALGTAETVQVDLTYVDLRRGDVLMMCSDGLSGMIRAEEIREVLTTVPEPFDACRVLIERANMAGGHDNVTVIVSRFDGTALPEPTPNDTVAYRKYALPELPTPEAGVPTQPVNLPTAHAAAQSDEALRESRRLRVGHTMVGMQNSGGGDAALAVAAPQAPMAPPEPVGRFSGGDDPVQLPTSGLPPSVVGVMVLVCMVAVAVGGFFLLR
jgi:protein phosphatase